MLLILRLEVLNAGETQLKEIIFDDCGPNEKTSLFPQLRSLSLNQNLIDNVSRFIFKLSKLNVLNGFFIY